MQISYFTKNNNVAIDRSQGEAVRAEPLFKILSTIPNVHYISHFFISFHFLSSPPSPSANMTSKNSQHPLSQCSDNIDIPLNQDLLSLIQLPNNILRHSQRISSNIDRRKCQPLRNTNINYSITLIELHPMQVLCLRCVFNIMPCIVGEDGGIARGEIKGARVARSDEDGCAGVARLEVQPFCSLRGGGGAGGWEISLGERMGGKGVRGWGSRLGASGVRASRLVQA